MHVISLCSKQLLLMEVQMDAGYIRTMQATWRSEHTARFSSCPKLLAFFI